MAWETAEVVSVGVYVPECPGRVGAYLGPESFDVAAAVRVAGWAADGNFRGADYGSAGEARGTAGATVGAKFGAGGAFGCIVDLEGPTVVDYIASWCWGGGSGWEGLELGAVGGHGAITVIKL